MKILIGIQARSKSSRLSNKSLQEIWGKPIVMHCYDAAMKAAESAKKAKHVDVVVSVLVPGGDSHMVESLKKHNAHVFEDEGGDEGDLVGRYRRAIAHYAADCAIRITGDCPAIPPQVIEACMNGLLAADYTSNTMVRSYPEGFDIQGASAKAWDWINENEKEKEHPFKEFDQNVNLRQKFLDDGFVTRMIFNDNNEIFIKLSIDTQEDLDRMSKSFKSPEDIWG